MEVNVNLLQQFAEFLRISFTDTGIGINSNSDNQQLAEELHKYVIRKFKTT